VTRRILAGLVIVAATALLVVATGAGGVGPSRSYKVRAIFDNATFIIPGEDVKIAGAKVGRVDSLDVTPQHKAAIVLDITEPGYADFRRDAHCTIRPESLIGERFVECAPTVGRSPGQAEAPPLKRIPDDEPGAGQYLLPVSRTSTPVDVDLIADTMRLPYRQRLSLIINELGTGLAANGDELRNVIHRANPALGELDKVLAILAKQNRTLADIAHDSDVALAPLARDRRRVADFIDQASQVAQATAARRVDLERNVQRLPTFLAELRPTTRRLSSLSDQAVPVLRDLHANAPAINTLIRQTGPFAEAALPATRALGRAGRVGGPALRASLPRVRQIQNLAVNLRPLATNANKLLTSVQTTGGIERLMDYIFYQSTAINGEDTFGHYLRAGLQTTGLSACSFYRGSVPGVPKGRNVPPDPTCSARFPSAATAPVDAGAASRTSRGAAGSARAAGAGATAGPAPATPTAGAGATAPSGGAATRATSGATRAGSTTDPTAGLLGYLMGSGR
jgi:phospholipid/cholesterol/gamma-HCH transport system substrate-binding protein